MMLLKDEVGMLRRVPLFSGVEPAKLKLLAFTSDRVSYSEGQILFNQGDEGDAAYVILKEFPEMTIEIVRVLADRLSHTTAELADARNNKH